MDTTIAVALISFLGTVIGTFAGILTSTKLTNYRLEQLEKKVDKHNNLVERMYRLESDVKILKEEKR
jgi:ABC-type lipoprotein release transport system permease subunit